MSHPPTHTQKSCLNTRRLLSEYQRHFWEVTLNSKSLSKWVCHFREYSSKAFCKYVRILSHSVYLIIHCFAHFTFKHGIQLLRQRRGICTSVVLSILLYPWLDYNHSGTGCPIFALSKRLKFSFNLRTNVKKRDRSDGVSCKPYSKYPAWKRHQLMSSNQPFNVVNPMWNCQFANISNWSHFSRKPLGQMHLKHIVAYHYHFVLLFWVTWGLRCFVNFIHSSSKRTVKKNMDED